LLRLALHFDLRAPSFGPPIQDVYSAMLQQCAWGDELGFSRVVLSSHHGCDDNYCPSELMTATAIATVTKRIRIAPVVILPLYDPLHVAEDVAVLDIISGGRVDFMVGAGYRPAEFAMFKRSLNERGRLMEEGVQAVKDAWSGEPFQFRGESVMVRPRPVQQPHPPIVMLGDSRAAARRAARLADQFHPMSNDPSGWYAEYEAACRELGREPEPLPRGPGWMFLQVAEDPDAMFERIAPSLLHVTNSYAVWLSEAGGTSVYEPIADVEALKASGNFRIVTPDECVELADQVDELMLDPLFGGIDPDVAWESLKLFESRVLPRLRARMSQ